MNKIALLGAGIASFGMFLALLVVKANRLVAGTQLGVLDLPVFFWLLPVLVLSAGWAFSRFKTRGLGLVVLGNFLLVLLLSLLTLSSRELGANPISRVAPAGGYWLLLLGAWLIAYAGALELHRLWLASLGVLIGMIFLLTGALDFLSVLREYTANQSEFWQETLRHIQLAFAAWVLSSLLGVILGAYSASRPRVSSITLGLANALQTVPSIALFALLIP